MNQLYGNKSSEENFRAALFLATILDSALINAELGHSKVTPHILEMDDMKGVEGASGIKAKHFYNNLLSYENIHCIEIGTWERSKSSICAAMCQNKAEITFICNSIHSNSNDQQINNVWRNEFLACFEMYKGENVAAQIIEKDCFLVTENDLLLAQINKFNIFIYDGTDETIDEPNIKSVNSLNSWSVENGNSVESENQHYKALCHFYPFLENVFIYIVNDWNWLVTRSGVMQSIIDLQLKIKYQKEIRLTKDDSTSYDKLGWWNGISIFILEK